MGEIKVGCCGFAGSQADYFAQFDLIEIQDTFYQLPRLQTAERWRRTAPPGFVFFIKAWQLITHTPFSPTYRRLREKIDPGRAGRYGRFQPTAEVLAAWERSAAFARAVGAPVVLFQCPESFRPTRQNIANLRAFCERIDRAGLRLAWEPRGAWPAGTVVELCRDLDLVHCVDPFKDRPLYGGVQYFRLHGRDGYTYDYRYSDEELRQIREWAREKPSFVLFNNVHMKADAARFLRLLAGDE
jgi:uncharacterized protein YecE (DUF72 family)